MLGKTSEYAIRALVYIYLQNQGGKRPGFKEISLEIDSPEQFTAKVLRTLTREGIISSMKGRGGGFFFDQPESPLPLYDIVRLLEGKKLFTKCGFGLKFCDSENPCPLHDEYSKVRDTFFNMVSEKTIQLLAKRISDRKAVLSRPKHSFI
jgi:Rrf2 family protein